MGQTAKYLLPWPERPDLADGPDGFQDLALATETALGVAWNGVMTSGYAALTSNAAAPGSQWAAGPSLLLGNAPAGVYRLDFLMFWFQEGYVGRGMYTWARIRANSGSYATSPYQGTTPNGALVSTLLRALHTHSGGQLSVVGEFGFASSTIYLADGSTVAVERVSD